MDTVMYYICYPFGYVMKWCWELLGNYGLAIILFTLCTKIILLPVSVWVHKNSIKMVTIQPDINFIKAKYYGDRDRIAEEETKLYKKIGYSPFASVVPLLLQLLLLSAVVYIVKQPLTSILHISGETVEALARSFGLEESDQLGVIRMIQSGAETDTSLSAVVSQIKSFDLSFAGFSLGVEPYKTWGIYTLVPVIAGASSLLLCWVQNAINVLQAEQSKLNKYGMTVLSVGISLSLGFFVYSGVALYWVASNLFAIVQQLVLNAVINPKKYVDYSKLEESRAALADIERLGDGKKDVKAKENAKRERADYKRFFKIVNKHFVIYSERSGFYKYYEALISELKKRAKNMTIHYVTSDPDDAIFRLAETDPTIKPYYIGQKKLITLMMRMDADIVAMTTPDLDNYYIKRSLVRKDVEYIYVPHDMMSVHMGFRKAALDHFDTIFCTGEHVAREVRKTEEVYSLPEKTLVKFGYPLEEKLEKAYEDMDKTPHAKREILIGPSWQEDNLLDSCVDTLIEQLMCEENHIIVRPHPEYVKRYPEKIKLLTEKYAGVPDEKLTFELDFTTNKSTYSSDLLITDWSAIAYEFCFSTKKPVLFVNTKMKMENPEWEKLGLTPAEIYLRDKVGVALEKSELDRTKTVADELMSSGEKYKEKITALLHEHLYSYGTNGAEGAKYILRRLAEIQKNRKD
ncbi:MAG: membrane protein insertase YidC [Eubacteriales bacterium]|nr:membrane protein insertase YidC [Clostridiales bacterium]